MNKKEKIIVKAASGFKVDEIIVDGKEIKSGDSVLFQGDVNITIWFRPLKNPKYYKPIRKGYDYANGGWNYLSPLHEWACLDFM